MQQAVAKMVNWQLKHPLLAHAFAGYLPSMQGARATKASLGSLQQRMFEAFLKTARTVVFDSLPEIKAAAAAACHPLPAALGTIDAAPFFAGRQPGGYLLNPAALDSATHTTASLQGSSDGDKGVMRIPVGIAAITAHASLDGSASAAPTLVHRWCSSVIDSISPDQAAVTASLALHSVAAGAASHLEGLQTKVGFTGRV
jgi:hypothetical protein